MSKKKNSKKNLGKKADAKKENLKTNIKLVKPGEVEERKKTKSKIDAKKFPTLQLKKETDIAMDFATKTYQKFNKLIKSIILFGSAAKQTAVSGSDIDVIIIIDDATINWTQELIAWYREELDKIMRTNPYNKNIHINTIKLTTWWDDLIKGDPVVINILRYGETMIDFAGFFDPLKSLLYKGKIKSTPEAIYRCLQRAPLHISRSKVSELNSIEGLYWAMVDSSHAALIAAGNEPPSPEHIPINLKETFVDAGKLKMKYVITFRDLHILHRKISHGEITDLKGVEIDAWQEKTKEFLNVMTGLVKDLIDEGKV